MDVVSIPDPFDPKMSIDIMSEIGQNWRRNVKNNIRQNTVVKKVRLDPKNTIHSYTNMKVK